MGASEDLPSVGGCHLSHLFTGQRHVMLGAGMSGDISNELVKG
jgi:hypothetical protein